jgi:mevalonate kinase
VDKAPRSYSIPGKVFLLGEYSVLSGGPALLAATAPRFSAREAHNSREFHPKSPAGKFKRSLPAGIPPFEFYDAYGEAGGFGASTAQFALSYAMMFGVDQSWQEVYQTYRKLTSDEKLPPSGADLVAQWMGGVVSFDPEQMLCTQLATSFPWERLLVFSAAHQAGRKAATHDHLKLLRENSLLHAESSLAHELAGLTLEALAIIKADKTEGFGNILNFYGDVLREARLEAEATGVDRKNLAKLPGVIGVKGAGALQADCLVVWTEAECDREQIIAQAEGFNLKWIRADGANTPGIQEDKPQ